MIYAKCHPDLKHYSHGLCANCYHKKRYHERRALGMPIWAAQGGTVNRWVKHYPSVKAWRLKNRDKVNAQYKRKREKRKRLYGSGDLRTMESRLKWLEGCA